MSLSQRSVVAALLLIVPVSAELVWPSSFGHRGDLVFAASQVVGWLLLASVVRDGSRRNPGLDASGAGRRGRRLLMAACFLQVAFALLYGATTAANGEPLEASFVLFLLGFLAQFAGGLAWSRALRRAGLRTARVGILIAAGGGILAMVVASDPFHDVFLLASYAAWAVVGAGLAPRVASSGRALVATSTEDGTRRVA